MVLHVCLEVPTLLMWDLCSAGSNYYVVISTGPLSELRVKIPIAGLLLISAEDGGWEKTVRLWEGWSINISMQPLQAMHSPGLPWDNGVKFTVDSRLIYRSIYLLSVSHSWLLYQSTVSGWRPTTWPGVGPYVEDPSDRVSVTCQISIICQVLL